MPFTLMREYVEYEHSWWRFCGVYDTRDEADKALAIIKDGEYDKKRQTDYSDFFIYQSDMNELVYIRGKQILEPKWWLKKHQKVQVFEINTGLQ
jgi:hypothetical protein